MHHAYGWVRQLPDLRDLKFTPRIRKADLPASVDLSPKFPAVFDQGQLGSCGPNSLAGLLAYDEGKQGRDMTIPSRLFLYWNTRKLMGTTRQDSGVDNRTMLKALAQWGFCPETDWPYDVDQYRTKPPKQAFVDAAPEEKVLQYEAVAQQGDVMKAALAQGLAIVVGFTVYESFESDAVAKTGVVPLPSASESVLGGHDVVCVGYDDAQKTWKFRNSWGSGWGQSGYGLFPYAYLLDPDLSDDFWTVTRV